MKNRRRFLDAAVLIFVLFALLLPLTGCGGVSASFSYDVHGDEDAEYRPGDTVFIVVTMINNGMTLRATGSSSSVFRPSVYLSCEDYKIQSDAMADTCDVVNAKLRKGDSVANSFFFTVPDGAPSGGYSLTVSYPGVAEKTFPDVLTVSPDLPEHK